MIPTKTPTSTAPTQESLNALDFLTNGDASVDQVDQAMKQMDKKFHTQFYTWIRNENNVDYISYYLRRVITEYEQEQFPAISRAVQWLVDGWSVQRTAELLIKLFYHWGIGDPKFASLVIQITQQWPASQLGVVDLVVTLVIGERSSKTARFIHYLTSNWTTLRTTELVEAVAVRLRWTERYFKHFLLQVASLGDRSWETKRTLVYSIRQRFNSRQFFLQHPNQAPTEVQELVAFSLNILRQVLDLDSNPTLPSKASPSSPRYPPRQFRPNITSPTTYHLRQPTTAPSSPFMNPGSSSLPEDHHSPITSDVSTPQPSPCSSSAKVLLTTR